MNDCKYVYDVDINKFSEDYDEMKKIIKSDFQRLIYFYEKYENNE